MLKTIHLIAGNATQGVFFCNLMTLQVMYVNDAFASLFGLSKDELMVHPKKLAAAVCTEDINYLQHRHTELIMNGSFTDAEFCISFPGEIQKRLRCDASVIDGHIIGFVKDISKEKEYENYLINHLAQADLLLEQLTNPSTHIGSSLKSKNRLLAEVKVPIEQEQQLTRHFLKKQNHTSEKLAVKKTRFDLLHELPAILEQLGSLHDNKRFRLICDQQHLVINTDPVKLFQILQHLISNAVKHAPASELIDIIIEVEPHHFTVRVKDNGPGIPENVQPEIFRHTNAPEKRGLQSVQMLVELLQGRVSCTSVIDKGTSIAIELPKE